MAQTPNGRRSRPGLCSLPHELSHTRLVQSGDAHRLPSIPMGLRSREGARQPHGRLTGARSGAPLRPGLGCPVLTPSPPIDVKNNHVAAGVSAIPGARGQDFACHKNPLDLSRVIRLRALSNAHRYLDTEILGHLPAFNKVLGIVGCRFTGGRHRTWCDAGARRGIAAKSCWGGLGVTDYWFLSHAACEKYRTCHRHHGEPGGLTQGDQS